MCFDILNLACLSLRILWDPWAKDPGPRSDGSDGLGSDGQTDRTVGRSEQHTFEPRLFKHRQQAAEPKYQRHCTRPSACMFKHLLATVKFGTLHVIINPRGCEIRKSAPGGGFIFSGQPPQGVNILAKSGPGSRIPALREVSQLPQALFFPPKT